MTFLSISALTKRFADIVGVDRLTIDIKQGEFISLLGPSGCGKSTTLQMLAGFIEPSEGRVTLDGIDLLATRPNERGLGIVFQSYALFPHMTVRKNIAFGLEMRKVARDELDYRVGEAIKLVGLTGLGERYPAQMSGGQQQRVALARALVIRPRLLLLDEPLSNLDAKLREGMQEELRNIQQTMGTTTILVTHDQSEALALSDRIVVMNRGKVEQIGCPLDVYDKPANDFVANFLGKTNQLGSEASASLVGRGSSKQNHGVRPERLTFADEGLSGVVKSRMFLGSQWQFRVDTAAGEALVTIGHDGSPVPEVGTQVLLRERCPPQFVPKAVPTDKKRSDP